MFENTPASLIDSFGRSFPYVRLSLTELCNFKCNYCLPNGIDHFDHSKQPLDLNEIENLISALSDLGVKKIRLTGGEPTLRKDFLEIAQMISSFDSIEHLALTTNGFQLKKMAPAWKKAGIDSLNISVDSLDEAIFEKITGRKILRDILEGIDSSIELGFKPLKINTVLMKGFNDELFPFLEWLKEKPVSLRFIELMPTSDNQGLIKKRHQSVETIRAEIEGVGWTRKIREFSAGPADEYFHPGFKGSVGLISPYSRDFCSTCNRLRISSTGHLKLCLLGEGKADLRDLLSSSNQKDELKKRILNSLEFKKELHAVSLDKPYEGSSKSFAEIGG